MLRMKIKIPSDCGKRMEEEMAPEDRKKRSREGSFDDGSAIDEERDYLMQGLQYRCHSNPREVVMHWMEEREREIGMRSKKRRRMRWGRE